MIPSLIQPLLANFWMPESGSTFGDREGSLFWFITLLSIFFFCLITGLLLYFVVRYRRRPGHVEQPSPTHNLPLEVLWSGIPIGLVVLIFVLGYRGFLFGQTPPANCYEIQVEAQQWSWSFIYPNGLRFAELHVPVNQPVKLTLRSSDVIHSLSIPALSVRRDVVPGRLNTTWFAATLPGESQVYCSEYCGTKHSQMTAKFVVHRTQADFDAWLADASRNALDELAAVQPDGAGMLAFWRQNPDVAALLTKYPQLKDLPFIAKLKPMWMEGQEIYQQRCATCHDAGIGPSFKGLWKRGTEQVAVRGQGAGLTTIKVDEDYIRESIEDPGAKIVKGFDNRMSSFKGQFSDRQIQSLVEFIKRQSEPPGGAPVVGPGADAEKQ